MSDNFYCRPNVSLNKRETQLSKSRHVGRWNVGFQVGFKVDMLGHRSRGQFDGTGSTASRIGTTNESGRSHCGFKAILLAYFVISRKSTLGTEKFPDWNSPGEQTRKTRNSERRRAGMNEKKKKDYDESPITSVTCGGELDFASN